MLSCFTIFFFGGANIFHSLPEHRVPFMHMSVFISGECGFWWFLCFVETRANLKVTVSSWLPVTQACPLKRKRNINLSVLLWRGHSGFYFHAKFVGEALFRPSSLTVLFARKYIYIYIYIMVMTLLISLPNAVFTLDQHHLRTALIWTNYGRRLWRWITFTVDWQQVFLYIFPHCVVAQHFFKLFLVKQVASHRN